MSEDERGDGPLAVVVAKPDAEDAIAALEAEGVYDTTRKVVEHGDDSVALPVTAPPRSVEGTVVAQSDPTLRSPDLADLLRDRGWDEEAIDAAPSSWAVVGTVILADVSDCPPDHHQAVGEALLDLHGEADTVLAREGIDGPHREPSVRVVAGEGDTETVHTEHGTRYALDLSRVMFSPGNQAERARMGDVVGDERVLDMFAGIGYFALPMARAGARVTAVERNPVAFGYLTENAVLNGVTQSLDAVLGDCRDVSADGVDRVVMGHYDACSYLDTAFDALADAGTLHVHATVPEARLPERPRSRVADAAAEHGYAVVGATVREVKSYSEGVVHTVVDARVERR